MPPECAAPTGSRQELLAFSEVHGQIDLERAIALSEALLEDASWGAVLVDVDLRPTVVNAHAARALGGSRTALLGRPARRVGRPGSRGAGGRPAPCARRGDRHAGRAVGDAADGRGRAAAVLAQRIPAAGLATDGGAGSARGGVAVPGRHRRPARGAGGRPAAVPDEPAAPGRAYGLGVRGPDGGRDLPAGLRARRVRRSRPGRPDGGRAPGAYGRHPVRRARPVPVGGRGPSPPGTPRATRPSGGRAHRHRPARVREPGLPRRRPGPRSAAGPGTRRTRSARCCGAAAGRWAC
ncbi:hypothetical protein SBADM41S_01993 [Streptomyces badius]